MHLWQTDQERFNDDMRDIVRRMMLIVRLRRDTFVARPKPSGTKLDDVVTDADEASEMFLEAHLQARFPLVGIIGEEGLRRPWDPANPVYWTGDPIDGTKAFVWRVAHGFSVMLSLVENGKIVAACIGDVMGHVLYWFAPGQEPVCEDLVLGTKTPLRELIQRPTEPVLIFGNNPETYDPFFARLCRDGVFSRYEINRGSIGLRFADIWRGAATATVMRGGRNWTPWDDTPTLGFSRELGVVYLAFDPARERFTRMEPPLVREETFCEPSVLAIHESRLSLLEPWLDKAD